MNKDIIKVQKDQGYIIDVAGEILADYEFVPSTAATSTERTRIDNKAKTFVPFRLTFLGPPNIRGQQPDAGKDGRYHITVGTQQV